MPLRVSSRRHRSARGAFSLVEVALALGIAGFVLVGLIGAIPVASSVGRQSIDQTRAASIAATVFTSLRAGKFGAASLDEGANTIDLNGNAPAEYQAYFDETVSSTPTDSQHPDTRLHFAPVTGTPPTTVANNPVYLISLSLNNYPGKDLTPPNPTLAPYEMSPGVTHAKVNAVEVSVRVAARPKDVYRFSSVVANRTD